MRNISSEDDLHRATLLQLLSPAGTATHRLYQLLERPRYSGASEWGFSTWGKQADQSISFGASADAAASGNHEQQLDQQPHPAPPEGGGGTGGGLSLSFGNGGRDGGGGFSFGGHGRGRGLDDGSGFNVGAVAVDDGGGDSAGGGVHVSVDPRDGGDCGFGLSGSGAGAAEDRSGGGGGGGSFNFGAPVGGGGGVSMFGAGLGNMETGVEGGGFVVTASISGEDTDDGATEAARLLAAGADPVPLLPTALRSVWPAVLRQLLRDPRCTAAAVARVLALPDCGADTIRVLEEEGAVPAALRPRWLLVCPATGHQRFVTMSTNESSASEHEAASVDPAEKADAATDAGDAWRTAVPGVVLHADWPYVGGPAVPRCALHQAEPGDMF